MDRRSVSQDGTAMSWQYLLDVLIAGGILTAIFAIVIEISNRIAWRRETGRWTYRSDRK
jgi:hypothetical protein